MVFGVIVSKTMYQFKHLICPVEVIYLIIFSLYNWFYTANITVIVEYITVIVEYGGIKGNI